MRKMLGFFFVAILLVLVFLTMYIQGWSFKTPKKLTIWFDKSVEGLRKGDDVRVEGILYGKVARLALNERAGVNVEVDLDRDDVDLHLNEDGTPAYDISVEAFTILGGNFVSIKRGVGPRKADLKEPLVGKTKPSPFEAFAHLAEDNRDKLKVAIQNLGEAAGEIKKIGESINKGEGTIGKLIKEPTLHDEAKATLEDARKAITDIRGAVTDVRAKLNSTENSVGKVLNTPELHDELVKSVREVKESVTRAVDDIKALTQKAQDKNAGPLGALLSDTEMKDDLKKTAENLKKISQDVEKVSDKLSKGEGTLGKLVMQDELYQEAKKTLEGVDKVLGRAGRAHVYVVGEAKSYPDSKLLIAKAGLRIEPDETKYFYAGVTFLSLDAAGPIRFESQQQGGGSDTEVTFDALAFYRIPWFLTEYVGVKAGMIEGKFGGGVEVDFEPFARWPVHIDFEIRDAYNDLSDEDIDEEIRGPMTRVWARVPLWTRPLMEKKEDGTLVNKSAWWENVLYAFKVFGGVSRIQDDPEFFVGIGLEYRDEDIKALVGLVSSGR